MSAESFKKICVRKRPVIGKLFYICTPKTIGDNGPFV